MVPSIYTSILYKQHFVISIIINIIDQYYLKLWSNFQIIMNVNRKKLIRFSWNSTGEIGRIGRYRAETHRYFYIRFFGPMPPDASDFPGGIPALVTKVKSVPGYFPLMSQFDRKSRLRVPLRHRGTANDLSFAAFCISCLISSMSGITSLR